MPDKPTPQGVSGPPSAGQPTNDTQKLTLDGVDYSLDEVRRLRDTRQNLEADYTKKTQELAESRKEVEPFLQWRDFFSQHPDLASKVAEMVDKTNNGQDISTPAGGDNGGLPPDPEVAKLHNRMNAMEQQRENERNQAAYETEVVQHEQQLLSDLARLKAKYPMAIPEVALAHVSANEKADLEEVMKASHEQMSGLKDEWLKGYIQKKGAEVVIEGAGGTPTSPEPFKPEDLNLADGSVRRASAEYLKKAAAAASS